jgi:hypothetical protein
MLKVDSRAEKIRNGDPKNLKQRAIDADALLYDWLTLVDPGRKVKIFTVSGFPMGLYAPGAGSRGSRISKLNLLLEDVEPLEIPVSFYLLDDIELKEKWLRPVDITDKRNERHKDYSFYVMRSSDENIVRGAAHPVTFLLILRLTIGKDKFLVNPMIRMLKHYVNIHDGKDIGAINRMGAASETFKDTMCWKRFLLLLNGAFWYEQFKNVWKDELWIELLTFLFQDPMYNMKVFADLTMLFRMNQSALCVPGKIPVTHEPAGWIKHERRYPGFTVRELEGIANDQVYYSYCFEKLQEDRKEMLKLGLPNLCSELGDLIITPPNHDSLRRMVLLRLIDGLIGFGRGYATTCQLDTVTMEKTYHDPPYGKFLERGWRELIESRCDIGGANPLPTEDEWRRDLMHSLTSRSAGGDIYRVKFDAPKDMLPRGAKYDWKFRSKRLVGLGNPGLFLNGLSEKRTYTEEDPGKIGSREVPGAKPVRPIYQRRAGHFGIEVIFRRAIQSASTRDDNSNVSFNSSNVFSTGKDVGIITVDMSQLFAASSRPDILATGIDYTAFDVHQTEWTMRQYMVKGIQEGLRRIKKDGIEYAGFKLKDIVDFIWGVVPKDAVYEFGSRKYGDIQLVALDQLQSGELFTIDINNQTNMALFDAFLEAFAKTILADHMDRISTRFQGDDSEHLWRVGKWTPKLYDSFVSLLLQNTLENNFKLNVFKTLVRLYMAEYLQKTVLYGFYVPKLMVAVLDGERTPPIMSPIEKVQNFYSVVQTVISRGGDPDFLQLFTEFLWIITRGIRSVRPSKDMKGERITEWLYLPPALLYAPKGMHGAGFLPWMPFGASIDSVIALYAMQDEETESLLNLSFNVVDFSPSRTTKTVVSQFVKGAMGKSTEARIEPVGAFSEGLTMFKEAMSSNRCAAASKVYDEVISRLPSIESMGYLNSPNSNLEVALASDPKLQILSRLENIRNLETSFGRLVHGVRKISKKGIRSIFPWLDGLKIVVTELFEKKGEEIHPMLVLPEKSRLLFEYLGYGDGRNTSQVIFHQIMRILRSDKFYRRDLTEEAIIRVLSHPLVLLDSEFMVKVMIFLGISTDAIMQIMDIMNRQGGKLSFLPTLTTFSLFDYLLPILDLWSASRELVDMISLTDQSLDSLLRQILTLYSLAEYSYSGHFRRVRVVYEPGLISRLSSLKFGGFGTLTRYMTV